MSSLIFRGSWCPRSSALCMVKKSVQNYPAPEMRTPPLILSLIIVAHCMAATGMKLKLLTSISDGLDLVDIKVIDDGIKAGVKVIQKVNNLQGSATTSNLRKSNNITASRGGREEIKLRREQKK